MSARISGQADFCREQARRCEELADDPTYDAITRRDLLAMKERWEMLARSFDVALEISGYLEWQAQRVEPPPGFILRPTG